VEGWAAFLGDELDSPSSSMLPSSSFIRVEKSSCCDLPAAGGPMPLIVEKKTASVVIAMRGRYLSKYICI
jgi:hypothetical protein